MPYGVSLFGEGEDWEYDVGTYPDDLEYGIDDFVRELDLDEEQESAVNQMLKDYTNAGSQ